MKGFYDKMLPNEIGKYVKQWGGKVEKGTFTRPTAEIRPHPNLEGRFAIYVGDEATSSPMTRELAEESLKRYREAEAEGERSFKILDGDGEVVESFSTLEAAQAMIPEENTDWKVVESGGGHTVTEVVENGKVLTTYDQPDATKRQSLAMGWIELNKARHPNAELRERTFQHSHLEGRDHPADEGDDSRQGPVALRCGGPAEQVQDDTDVVSNPLAPRGHLTRFLSFITGDKGAGRLRNRGHWKAGGKFNDAIQEAMRTKVQNGKSLITNAAFLKK